MSNLPATFAAKVRTQTDCNIWIGATNNTVCCWPACRG